MIMPGDILGTSGDGKLFGIVPKGKEREVAFIAAVLGIVMFALYMRNKNAAVDTTSTATDAGGSTSDLSGYDTGGGGYSIPSGTSSAGGTSSVDNPTYDSEIATLGTNQQTLQTGLTAVQTAINSLTSTQTSAAASGTGLTFDFSNEFTTTGSGSSTGQSQTTSSSGSSGGGGILQDIFGGGGSSSNSSTTTGTESDVWNNAIQNTQSASASATNIDETEYNSLLTTGAELARNNEVTSAAEVGVQAPPITQVVSQRPIVSGSPKAIPIS
jgi:hypothetical protein